MPFKNYDDFLDKELKDPEVAAEYLNAALESGAMEEFLVALRNVARSHGGPGELARMTRLNRQSLYKMLSENGNPTLGSLMTLLKVMRIRLTFSPSQSKAA